MICGKYNGEEWAVNVRYSVLKGFYACLVNQSIKSDIFIGMYICY